MGLTTRIFASNESGNSIPNALGLRRASFYLEAESFFPYGVYEEEGIGALRLDVLMNLTSSQSLEPSLRTPQKGFDSITFWRVLQASV